MELFRALGVLAESPAGPETARLAGVLELGAQPSASDYTEAFVFQLYPYASVYLGAEGMLGGEARDRVAGFWRALGHAPPSEADHLPVMLSLYARLSELEEGETLAKHRERWRGARRAFLWEHLLSWLPVYLGKMSEIAPPFYRRWAGLLQDALAEEASKLGAQETLSLHLREAPGVVDPRSGGAEEFLGSLLAPVRSGIILTRSDLSRAALSVRVGSRIGERKFILKALMSQDARGTLGWLAEEARRSAARHREQTPTPLGVSGWWAERAETTASLLEELETATDSAQVSEEF
ncbi:MAG TPA: molecular chaperone TorD family protein [Pyrinomonadaceae bacterium]|nr:molecular chaperone TorD family protein [Pyrinomonadaceae bacterium]